jgi:sodium-dependent dicarboxylate transporter 2/3/5
MVYWITEAIPIPVTGLIGIALCVLMNVGPAREVIAGFGDPAIFLFIGAFIIAEAMLKHGVARRFAFRILSLRVVGSSTTRIVIAFGIVTTALSAFISNTATVAMLLPTALGIVATLGTLIRRHDPGLWEHATDADGVLDPSRLRVGTALMLMLAFGASVGGLLTPVGTPTNIIGRRLIEDATHSRLPAMGGDRSADLPRHVPGPGPAPLRLLGALGETKAAGVTFNDAGRVRRRGACVMFRSPAPRRSR